MIYKYEMACREAGLSEEKIREIDRVFDSDKKKLKARKKSRMEEHEKNGFATQSLTALGTLDDGSDLEVADPGMDIEGDKIRAWEHERLQVLLARLPEEDKDLLLQYYGAEHGGKKELAETLGITRRQLDYRVSLLVQGLRAEFDE